MTTGTAAAGDWTIVDEGWGRKAVDFATLSEPANCREYDALHHRLGVDAGDRLLDIACGAGLALELARLRGCAARCAPVSTRHRDWSRSPGTATRTPTYGWVTCMRCLGRTVRSTS